MMVHSAVGFSFGSPGDLRRAAIELEQNNEKFIAMFHRSDPALVRNWFADGDHYFSAQEAVAAGLADEVLPEPNPQGDIAAAMTRELLGRLKAALGDDARFAATVREFL